MQPATKLCPIDVLERASIRGRRARIWTSKLPEHVGERELAVVREELKWRADECSVENVPHPVGPGNAAVFTGFGERGRPAEEVAKSAVEAAKAWLDANVPVDEHLADQLLLPMALAGKGSFQTTKPSLHTTTNAGIIRRFLPAPIRIEPESELVWRVQTQAPPSARVQGATENVELAFQIHRRHPCVRLSHLTRDR